MIEKYEDPAGDGNRSSLRFNKNLIAIEKYEDPAGDGNHFIPPSFDVLIVLRNTKTPQGTETLCPHDAHKP